VNHEGEILLQQRPARGIWGGLWCLPQYEDEAELRDQAAKLLRSPNSAARVLPRVSHSFTHFDLDIVPWQISCQGFAGKVADEPAQAATVWYNPGAPQQRLGLPAPIKLLIENLES
jgi:A/G-specific adenine glycosylase